MENKKNLVNGKRLVDNLKELGQKGKDEDGVLSRLALTKADKEGRDLFVSWLKDAGLEVKVDKIGNIFGIWATEENKDKAPVMMGSHIDSVINAGIYDGCFGSVAGIEVIRSLKESGFKPSRPIVAATFTDEEGVRYQPDMLGSLVYAGDLDLEEALDTVGIDGTRLGNELKAIGYDGDNEPGFIKPYAFIEAHVEQGPVLDSEGLPVGIVESIQGISWQKCTIEGEANHAGTTPTRMRVDAGLATAKVIKFLRELADASDHTTVATVGSIEFEPNLINVVPSKSTFTIDLRDPKEELLLQAEKDLEAFLSELEKSDGVKISRERLARFEPVIFDEGILDKIEKAVEETGLDYMRMTSGAGHDAQMMARICPTAMIFAPSIKGISHNPGEDTKPEDLTAVASILLSVVKDLSK